MKGGTLRKLLAGATTAAVACVYTGKVVRRLRVVDDVAEVDLMGDGIVLKVPLDTQLFYEAWCMDRGSITWRDSFHGTVKFCTEHDWLELLDGTRSAIESTW